MKSDTRLDSAVFQLTPTRTRCDLVIIANGKTEKIASGLLEPFVTHLKAAHDQIAKGGYSVTLEPDSGSDPTWFTMGTMERFVRFVSTPEVLERVNTIESEMLQIDEAISVQSNGNLGLSTQVENHQMKSTENIEDIKSAYDADAEKAIILFKPGIQPSKSNEPTTLEENSKAQLLRVLETRKTVLQKEQGMAFARAIAAGFDMDHMAHLLSFAESFGASRLMEACMRFMELWKQKHETGQWLDIEAMEAMSSRSDFSSLNASGIIFSNEIRKQKEFSEAWPEILVESAVEGNEKMGNEFSANMSSQLSSSDHNGDKRSPFNSQVPLGPHEYSQGYFQHPMYPQWPIHSPSGVPVFQPYPMQSMPYYQNYQAGGAFFHPLYPPAEDSRFTGAHRMRQKRHSMDSKDSNAESETSEMGVSNGRSQDGTDHSMSEKELQGQETRRKGGRLGKSKSGMVVIRNINYITSDRHNASENESQSSSECESDDDAEKLQPDAPKRKHKKPVRSSKRKGSITKSTDNRNSNDGGDLVCGQETGSENWQAFQNFLLQDEEQRTSTADGGIFSAKKEASVKRQQMTSGSDPILNQRDMGEVADQWVSEFDTASGKGPQRYQRRGSNDELAISNEGLHLHGGAELRDDQLDVQSTEVESGKMYRRGTHDDFMLSRQGNHPVLNSHSDPLASNEWEHANNLDKSSSLNVTDESFIVPFRSSSQDQVGQDSKVSIDIDSEFPSMHEITEDSTRIRSQLSYEPDDLSLMPERTTPWESTGYDPAVDYEMEVHTEDVTVSDNGNQEDGSSVKKEGSKKSEKEKKSRAQDALEKRKMEAAMKKGKFASKLNPLAEAQMRAERLRAFKADLQKTKREKEEEEKKRLEALKRERQKRIAARGGSNPSQPPLPTQQTKSQLPTKLSPISHKGSKFSDSEPGSSSPLQRLHSKAISAVAKDSQKTTKPSKLSSGNSAGNGLSQSVSSLPELKKVNGVHEPKAVSTRIRRLSDPKGYDLASHKSGGSKLLTKSKVSDETESKKISKVMSLDRTKFDTLPDLKIKTSKSNLDLSHGKSAPKEIKQKRNGSRSSLTSETTQPKKSNEKIPDHSSGDDKPVMDKTVVRLEHGIPAAPDSLTSEQTVTTEGVPEYASIHAPASPILIDEVNQGPSEFQLDEHPSSKEVTKDSSTDELPKTLSANLPEKPYEAPYARLSSLEDRHTSNSESSNAPPISSEMETIMETVRAHVSDFTEKNSPELISESLEKPRGKESSKGFKGLLKFGRKNHSSAMGEHGIDTDKLNPDGSATDDHDAATVSSNEVHNLKNHFSQYNSYASGISHKVSRPFSLLSPFWKKTVVYKA